MDSRLKFISAVCLMFAAACGQETNVEPGNTELNVVVPNNESSPGVPAPIDIGTVEYTINCLGNDDVFLDNNASFPDEVIINGNLEVVDGRTDPQGAIPPEFGTPRPGDGAEIWQAFMDLPPGPCTIQLRARDNDGEVICTATESFSITADTTSKVNLVLICDVSFQAPVGMLDVDATFSFVVGNFCPDLFQLNCVESNPPLNPVSGSATTYCETRYRDGDGTCGQSCDPQTCVPVPEGLSCLPGPDPGVSTTVTCDNGAVMDCEGDLTPDASCTWTGDATGAVGEAVPVPLALGGPGPLPGGFFVSCGPTTPSGGTITCTAITTDGDTDCDKTKTVSFDCPGLTACEAFDEANGGSGSQAGADVLCEAAGNDCTVEVCDNVACDGVTSGTCCASAGALPANTPCTCPSGPAVCDGAGECNFFTCITDSNCDDGNECTVERCEPVFLGTCSGSGCTNTPLVGASCAGGTGTCDANAICIPN